MMLEGEEVRLRAVEPEDAERLCLWENDSALWRVSGTTEPFSLAKIRAFCDLQREGDIFRTGDLRLMMDARNEAGEWQTVGAVDLFEFDALAQRAGVGILVYPDEMRGRGYAAEALGILCRYARGYLRLHQLWCNVGAGNAASLRLFRSAGFEPVGLKKEWQWTGEGFEDEWMLQKIL